MTKRQDKKLENLEQKASNISGIISTLREAREKVEKRIKEAHDMAIYPNQKYAKEWASEETHQRHNLENLEKVIKDYSDQLDKVCAKIDQIEREKARW